MLAGLAVAVANLDEIIALIRKASDPAAARQGLMERPWPAAEVAPLIELIDEPDRKVEDGHYRLSEIQAKAILELRLHRLTGLERDKIGEDLRELGGRIAEYLEILSSRQRLYDVLKDELLAMREQFATPRRTAIEEGEFSHDIEDLIQREDMVVTVTNSGYIKRVPLSTYRAQRRGGKGRAGMRTRDEDFVAQIFVVNTHTPVLFFSSTGIVYKLKVYKLPLGSPTARGNAMINLLPLKDGETITTLMPMPEDEESWGELSVMFATTQGRVRRNRLSDFVNVMANGKIAMKLDDGDHLVGVSTCTEDHDVLLAAHSGKCIRFSVPAVRVFSGRTSTGVRGIKLAKGDRIISMSILIHAEANAEERDDYLAACNARCRLEGADYTGRDEEKASDEALAQRLDEAAFRAMGEAEEFILTVTENGYGKRTSAYEYRVAGRGGQGIASIETSARNGSVVASFWVGDEDQIVMVTDTGQIIRCPVRDIRVAGRRTQGVTLFDLSDNERMVSVTRLTDVGNGEDGDTGRDVDEDTGDETGEETTDTGAAAGE